ncbi:hypothetical protein KC660_03190 [Candidatus Dojkabacteria bacterium]|uniref:Uncharacterized protein n=1 Tax=Candidatus Dojkabacteria bacterium TaxID=2099670 RepID=A0A955L3T5_9BACT|nr:hypothetical protein [Candidatus Dojkabacteria bacterium]
MKSRFYAKLFGSFYWINLSKWITIILLIFFLTNGFLNGNSVSADPPTPPDCTTCGINVPCTRDLCYSDAYKQKYCQFHTNIGNAEGHWCTFKEQEWLKDNPDAIVSADVPKQCADKGTISTGLGCVNPSIAGITTFILQLLLGIGVGIGVAKGGLAWWKWRNTESADKKQEAMSELIAIFSGLVIMLLAIPVLRLVGIDILNLDKYGGEKLIELFVTTP